MAYEVSTASDSYDLFSKIRTALEATLPSAQRWVVQRYLGATLGNVVSITSSGTTATVLLDTPHLHQTGDRVTISGCTETAYNVVEAVITTTVYPMSYTYTMVTDPSGSLATGTPVITRLNYEVIWKIPGISGTEELYGGIKLYHSTASDYYNMKLGGFDGYVPNNSFETQAGTSHTIGLPLWNQSTPYWLVYSGQRFILAAKVEAVIEHAYLGKCLPYATPDQWPYPLVVVGGLTTPTATRYSDTAHVSGYKGTRANFILRNAGGVWVQPDVAPFDRTHQLRNTITLSTTDDGYYGLHALVLSDSTPNVYGELDGVFYISGYNNASENTLVHSGITYVVLQDVWRQGHNDYIALRLS